MVKIAPSILAADSANFGREISALQSAGADYIHFDVMDGHFVPNLTFGPKILKETKSYSKLPFDVHLMVTCPERFIPWYAEAGADIITFHLEATDEPEKAIQMIKNYGLKSGISLKPGSDINRLTPFANMVDQILVMAVEPGFGENQIHKRNYRKRQNPYRNGRRNHLRKRSIVHTGRGGYFGGGNFNICRRHLCRQYKSFERSIT